MAGSGLDARTNALLVYRLDDPRPWRTLSRSFCAATFCGNRPRARDRPARLSAMPHNPSNSGKPRPGPLRPRSAPVPRSGQRRWQPREFLELLDLRATASARGAIGRNSPVDNLSASREHWPRAGRGAPGAASAVKRLRPWMWRSRRGCSTTARLRAEREIDFFATYKFGVVGLPAGRCRDEGGPRRGVRVRRGGHRAARRCLDQNLVGLGAAVGAAFPRARCIEAVSDDLRRCLPPLMLGPPWGATAGKILDPISISLLVPPHWESRTSKRAATAPKKANR
jgi:hypothetical protein